ncbi:hypothetical protein O181_008939 [Austropuccinia psidii MF-1]|uniref:Uncharacterized protein n=1 Tax=Austropuccinia psidii MF-1 TaxID=1389203 RepID=A0A9Q3GJC5_9BASI|nr:hypothetical protein [Austropuccinia psidii MF-1]
MLADKHKRNSCLLSNPSDHAARRAPDQDALVRTPLWSAMMKAFPSRNGCRDPKEADGNNSRLLALSPQSKVIIQPMKHGNGKRTFELGLIVTHGIQTPKHRKKQTKSPIPNCLMSKLCGNQLQAQVAPDEHSQPDEPPIPGPSPPSKPHEDVPTCEPETEVAPTQSMEEAFAFPAPPPSVIIINNMPIKSPLALPPSLHSHPGSFPSYTSCFL